MHQHQHRRGARMSGRIWKLEAMQASRIGSVFERSVPRSEPVNFFKTSHVNSCIISFLDTKEIASIIRLVNKQANGAARDAIRIQLSTKTSLTYKEIVEYQHSLGLEDPAAVAHLCVNQQGESNLKKLDLSNPEIYYNYNVDDILLSRFVALFPNLASLNLSCCNLISDAGLRVLLAACPRLGIIRNGLIT